MKISSSVYSLLSSVSLLNLAHAEEIVQIHGSGTTNPSKCIWHIMSLFNAQSKNPVRLTYRAVGSTTGQKEFLGVDNIDPTKDDTAPGYSPLSHHWPHTDFGAGDIPITNEAYKLLHDSTGFAQDGIAKMAHLPFALSSVSFFYRVDGEQEIDLTGCDLAKIFSREITHWDDPELVKNNPSLATIAEGLEIKVCRRKNGSSSTKSITKFLNRRCPSDWFSDMVGSTLSNWHPDTTASEGSGGMTECISEDNGSIGYLESGHGWSEGLDEISLENADGNFITSRYAFDNNGISSAASNTATPASAGDDWGSVDFIDKGGKNTYPIVLMSYVYVRREIYKHMAEKEQGLLRLFLESLYMDEYFGKCSPLAFTPVPESVKETAEQGIKEIIWSNPQNMWSFETSTAAMVGSNDYTISGKRQSYQGVAIDDIMAMDAKGLLAQAAQVQEIEALFTLAEAELDIRRFTSNDKGQVDTAIILSALSFTMCCVFLIGFAVKKFINV